jgi:hypothetical protein
MSIQLSLFSMISLPNTIQLYAPGNPRSKISRCASILAPPVEVEVEFEAVSKVVFEVVSKVEFEAVSKVVFEVVSSTVKGLSVCKRCSAK